MISLLRRGDLAENNVLFLIIFLLFYFHRIDSLLRYADFALLAGPAVDHGLVVFVRHCTNILALPIVADADYQELMAVTRASQADNNLLLTLSCLCRAVMKTYHHLVIRQLCWLHSASKMFAVRTSDNFCNDPRACLRQFLLRCFYRARRWRGAGEHATISRRRCSVIPLVSPDILGNPICRAR